MELAALDCLTRRKGAIALSDADVNVVFSQPDDIKNTVAIQIGQETRMSAYPPSLADAVTAESIAYESKGSRSIIQRDEDTFITKTDNIHVPLPAQVSDVSEMDQAWPFQYIRAPTNSDNDAFDRRNMSRRLSLHDGHIHLYQTPQLATRKPYKMRGSYTKPVLLDDLSNTE